MSAHIVLDFFSPCSCQNDSVYTHHVSHKAKLCLCKVCVEGACFYILMWTKYPHKIKTVRYSYLQAFFLEPKWTCSSHLKNFFSLSFSCSHWGSSQQVTRPYTLILSFQTQPSPFSRLGTGTESLLARATLQYSRFPDQESNLGQSSESAVYKPLVHQGT